MMKRDQYLPFEIFLDERNKIVVRGDEHAVELSIYHRMENFAWIAQSCNRLTKNQAKSLTKTLNEKQKLIAK